jgi:hypothetical protein
MTQDYDLLQICEVLYRYSDAMDRRDWPLMDGVFTADATAHIGGYLFPKGRDVIVATIRAAIECCSVTHHMNTNVQAQIDGDRAHVRHRFLAWHRGRGACADTTYLTLGTYTDEFVRTPEGWRIRHRQERNPVEIWGGANAPGDQQTFFAEAIAAFARVSRT